MITIPTQMKAVLLTGYGDEDVLQVRQDVAVPRPAANEVLIEVGACGMNNTDIWTREGAYGSGDDTSGWKPLQFPRIQGADVAGRIVQVGQDIAASRIGARVLVNPTVFPDPDNLLDFDCIGSERDGGFAQYVAVPAANAFAIETSLSDAELASFPCAYITAEHMLNRARVDEHDTVVVTGASGGVGSALVQLAKQVRGATVIAIVGRGKEHHLQALGADFVVVRQTDDLQRDIESAIAPGKVSVVADVVGGSMLPTVLGTLQNGGRCVVAGAIAGSIVEVDMRTVYLRHLEIIGATLGTHAEFADLVGYIEAGQIKPLVAQRFALHEIARAQAVFKQKQFFGNLVLEP